MRADPGSSMTDISYEGIRYGAIVPDTLDLAERAWFALNAICRCIDPDVSHHMFFHAFHHYRTPFLQHHNSDCTCDPKFAETIVLLRIMCGSGEFADLESAQRAELLGRVEHGLYWRRYDSSRPWDHAYSALDAPAAEDNAGVMGAAQMLRALMAWREVAGRSDWDDVIHSIVRGLDRIAVRRDDYSYFPYGACEPFGYPRCGWPNTDEPTSETEGGEGAVACYQAIALNGLMRWYTADGDPLALELAGRLARFAMMPKFWGGVPDPNGDRRGLQPNVPARGPDPVCIAGAEQGHWYSHHHARCQTLRGLLDYATVTGESRVLEFVRRAYEYTLSLSIPRIGWVNTRPAVTNLCEGCSLGDMAALGIRLTDAGAGDYWDDVDALVRNHLVEQQLLRADLLERIAQASPPRPAPERPPAPQEESTEDVIARTIGLFAAFSSPVSVPNPWVMQCCTSNCSRGLYYAWEGAVREDGSGVTQVNLLLNRAATTLDVESHLPHEGKVTVRNKSTRRIVVRIPSWVSRSRLQANRSGKPSSLVWMGNRLLFDDVEPGDRIDLEFPVAESTAHYTVASGMPAAETTYRCTFRASTLIDIGPRDSRITSYPLYLREHLRRERAPMKSVERFVPGRQIRNW